MADGNVLRAKVIETVYYWCLAGRTDRDDGMRYSTQKNEWIAEEIGCDMRVVERAFQFARDHGYIDTKGFKYKGERRRKTCFLVDPKDFGLWRPGGASETDQSGGSKPSAQTGLKPSTQPVSYNDQLSNHSKTYYEHSQQDDFSGESKPYQPTSTPPEASAVVDSTEYFKSLAAKKCGARDDVQVQPKCILRDTRVVGGTCPSNFAGLGKARSARAFPIEGRNR